jgi:hypothetical protein
MNVKNSKELHNEELHYLYSSLNIMKVIKSRRIKCVVQVACVMAMRKTYKTLV